MGLVCSEERSGGWWKRSDSRESWEGESTALSQLSAESGLQWGVCVCVCMRERERERVCVCVHV